MSDTSCSYENLFEDKKCPNVVCCKSKNIDGCWKCENVADCQTGFFNSGENDAKAYALYIKKYGTEKYTESPMLKSLKKQLAQTDTAIENMLNAIEQGIITKSIKKRLDEL